MVKQSMAGKQLQYDTQDELHELSVVTVGVGVHVALSKKLNMDGARYTRRFLVTRPPGHLSLCKGRSLSC